MRARCPSQPTATQPDSNLIPLLSQHYEIEHPLIKRLRAMIEDILMYFEISKF